MGILLNANTIKINIIFSSIIQLTDLTIYFQPKTVKLNISYQKRDKETKHFRKISCFVKYSFLLIVL